MNNKTLTEKLSAVVGLINDHSNRMAIDSLRELCSADSSLSAFNASLDAIEQRYYYMLRFLDSTAPFESVDKELKAIEDALETIAHQMHRTWCTANDPGAYYAQLRFQQARPEENLESLYADYIEESKRLATDTRVLTDTRAKETIERIASDIFMHIWTEPALSTDRAETLRRLIADSDIPHHDRELWVNAIGLSNFSDPLRSDILLETYRSSDQRLSVAALVWLAVSFARMEFAEAPRTKHMSKIMQELADDADGSAEIMTVVAEISRTVASDGSKWSRMIAELNNISRGLADSLKGGGINSPAEMENALSNAPEGYFDKMRAFQDAQLRGEDVYAGIVGAVPRAPFFRLIPAWFLPFHLDRSELSPIVDNEGIGMATIMEKMPMLCDNDKYTLLLSMTHSPEQTGMMMANLYESFTRMSETEEGAEMMKALEGKTPRPALIGNAARNLSRFVHYFTQASEASVPDKVTPYVDFVLRMFEGHLPAGFEDFADAIASAGFNDHAVGCYSAIISSADFDTDEYSDADRARVFAKAARAAAAADMAERAIVYFERAIQHGDDSLETAMQTTRLILDDPHGYFGDDPSASPSPVKMLEPYAESNTDNTDFLRLLGESYTAEGDYHRAAETYFNLNYILPPEDTSAKGPLAEALCSCGDFDEAVQVLADVPDIEKNMPLTVTQSIALWCTGARDASVRALQACLPYVDGNIKILRRELERRIHNYFTGNANAASRNSLYLLIEILDYKAFGSRWGNLS